MRGVYTIHKSKLPKFRFLSREISRIRVFVDWETEEYLLSLIEDFGVLFNKYEFRRGPEMVRINKLLESVSFL